MKSAMPSWRVLVAALMLVAALPPASALDVVSDDVPEGAVLVPPHGKGTIILDISPRDFVQWTWKEPGGHAPGVSTLIVWTDKAANEHRAAATPAGQQYGNFDAPAELAGARLEWHNAGDAAVQVSWAYSASAAFWKRPEFFLPSMLPLFLLAGAFWWGRSIDRRRRAGAAARAHLQARSSAMSNAPPRPQPETH